MTPTAIFEVRNGALHLLPDSSLPEPLRSNLETNPIPLDSDLYVARCARDDVARTIELDNHDQVPGAREAAFTWARFWPCHCDGAVSGVRAWYDR